MRRAPARRRPTSDDGSTLVAAVAVTALCLSLGVVVLTQAIVTSQDTGRDRARTVQVHGAEGAVDAMHAQLQTATPCRWPEAGGSRVISTDPQQTSVRVTLDYHDAGGGVLTCSAGVVTGTPREVVVTATAGTAGLPGQPLQRVVQSKVQLTAGRPTGGGAAIYSAAGALTTNGFSLSSASPEQTADLWVNSGNVNCNSSVLVDGNLVVANGTVDISNACRITGNLWTKQRLTVHQAHTGGLLTVGGNVFVHGANATVAQNTRIGGDLLVGGTLTVPRNPIFVGGATEAPSTRTPVYAPIPMPEVTYRPADFVGFADRSFVGWSDWVRENAVTNNAPTWSDPRQAGANTGEKCAIAGASYGLNGPLLSPAVDTVFDTRSCSSTRFTNGLHLRLRADMVIYARDIYTTGDFRVTSADGQPHRLWLIVPDPDIPGNGVAECKGAAGNIKGDSGSDISSQITAFLYTPCTVDTNNTSTFYGQVYGGTVNLRNAFTMKYVPIGIPNVTLPSLVPTGSTGNRVDIVYKREISAAP